ncbi:DNA topoisomerase I [Methanobacterium lacus]|uniref:DNA topoisomerase 1 n=1 Tax=Methanobacterium lacus (strain AL-21) TaxID=877455 RepID=F0T9W2_METLA|nr:DNA topoisomerase I [Methanobacterium lacus]ADZ08785.1 DNA topoisomerase I [Methanobacterium lacus]
MHEVIICEKPKASEKIASALSKNSTKKKYKKVSYYEFEENGNKTTVLTAVGHLYSLAPKNKNKGRLFDVEWVPLYAKDKKKKYVKDYVDAIKKFSKNADRFVHACDYDIEGTLIGYNALKYACGENSLDNAVRMKFSTLTNEDITAAYEKPLNIDFNQVDSGIARHVLDFLFGVNISKSLTESVMETTKRYIQLSAGRVQTPTLAILVEREKEIQKFIPEPYWMIKADLDVPGIDELVTADHKAGKIFDKNVADEIFADCDGKNAVVDGIDVRETVKAPPFPFDLGSLQSEAYAVFGFSPKKTQQIAQNLYTEGFTSYPRTSSQKLPKSIGVDKILKKLSYSGSFRNQIAKLKKPYKPNEGKKTDAAHPAIHPTGVIPKELSTDDRKLYELITYRFISVFGENGLLESMKTSLKIGDQDFSFSRKRMAKLGWMELTPFKKAENDSFPTISKDDELLVEAVRSEEKETKPPARYNQASLIRELEKRGLGTKSTRANIISILYDRKFVEGKKIKVNELGEHLIDTLKEYSNKITSEEMTREFETRLEDIIEGSVNKDNIIEEAKIELTSILDDIDKNKAVIGEQLYKSYRESRVVGKCKCGGNLVLIDSPRSNSFVGCSGYPECKSTFSLPRGATILKTTCEECGLPMISFGKPRQRACLDPKCGKDGQEPSNEIVGVCPDCGKDLIKRSGRYGEFIGCSAFPKCRYTRSLDEPAPEVSGVPNSTNKPIKAAAKKSGKTAVKKATAKKSGKTAVKKATPKKSSRKVTKTRKVSKRSS